ncbi:MAG: hypothetical protein ACK6BU_08155 [Cyanobacteriota bacterium]
MNAADKAIRRCDRFVPGTATEFLSLNQRVALIRWFLLATERFGRRRNQRININASNSLQLFQLDGLMPTNALCSQCAGL